MNNTRKVILGAAAVAAVILVGGSSGVVAAGLVTSADIKDGGVHTEDLQNGAVTSAKIKDGNVFAPDAAPGLLARIDSGKVTRLESDGPYPGATDLGDLNGQGDNSDELLPADGEIHQLWVECAPDKYALGGGYRVAADAGTIAAKNVHVTANEPTQIDNATIVYNPIQGDDAGSFRPNGWLVEAWNDGANPVVVRPWVVCAKITE